MRVITPQGEVKDIPSEDPEVGYFLSTEGQMGIIAKATLKVRAPGRRSGFRL